MKKILTILSICLITVGAKPQGCSDAGVCTAGTIGEIAAGLDSTSTVHEPPHSVRSTFDYVLGERGVLIMQVVP